MKLWNPDSIRHLLVWQDRTGLEDVMLLAELRIYANAAETALVRKEAAIPALGVSLVSHYDKTVDAWAEANRVADEYVRATYGLEYPDFWDAERTRPGRFVTAAYPSAGQLWVRAGLVRVA